MAMCKWPCLALFLSRPSRFFLFLILRFSACVLVPCAYSLMERCAVRLLTHGEGVPCAYSLMGESGKDLGWSGNTRVCVSKQSVNDVECE